MKQHQNEYSTPLTERSVGGLVVCGINFGGDENDPSNVQYCKPFVDQAQEDSFPFHRKILDWFGAWGHDLRGDMAAHADRLSHTNYFMDQSVAQKERTNEGWLEAFPGFVARIAALEPAGVLICSPEILHGAAWSAEKSEDQAAAARWRELAGEPYWMDSHRFGEGRNPFRALFRRHPDGGSRVAAITHTAARGITNQNVYAAAPVMGLWLKAVLS